MVTSRGKKRKRRRELRLRKLKAKAHLLGAELREVYVSRQGTLINRYLEEPEEDVHLRWCWNYPPHASDAIFHTAHGAYSDLLRFIREHVTRGGKS